MKYLIAALLILALAAFFWLEHTISHDAQNTVRTCPEWLVSAPQKGCE